MLPAICNVADLDPRRPPNTPTTTSAVDNAMRTLQIGLLCLFVLPLCAQDPLDDGEKLISSEGVMEHLRWLASDELKGRVTGSDEIALVGERIIKVMKQHGLKPAGDNKGYENKFPALNKVCRNICGIVLGSDAALRKEHVVVGAHYDHVGIGAFGSRSGEAGRGQVHNGADDNASGTSALLELIEALAAKPPKRSVLFLAFSGEELGLVGSKAWCKAPTVPVTQLTSMLNLDMIGRSRDQYLFVGGLNSGSNFESILREVNKPFAFALELHGGGRGPSDFDSFYAIGVPALFFFTAEHADYHTPADDADKINAVDLTRITRLAYRAVRRLGDGPKPKFAEDARQSMPRTSERGVEGPFFYLGARVAAVDQGVVISELSDSGDGAKNGLMKGDRLLQVDGKAVTGLEQVHEMFSLKRPATPLQLKVQRGRKNLTFKFEVRKA